MDLVFICSNIPFFQKRLLYHILQFYFVNCNQHFQQGNLWKESLDILKMAVSHSSHLDTPPPRPASSVWTAYDSSWSAEAMMIKKDLPGRTLDFTFDLSATPVIGQRVENPVEHGKENKLLSPVATVDLSGWRKPHLSQVHLRYCCNDWVTILYCCSKQLFSQLLAIHLLK